MVSGSFSACVELCLKTDADLRLHLLTLSLSQSQDPSPQGVTLQVIFSCENAINGKILLPFSSYSELDLLKVLSSLANVSAVRTNLQVSRMWMGNRLH